MIFKPRSKSNKNCNNEATKNKKKKTKKDCHEEDPTVSGREKAAKVENRKANAANVAREANGEDELHSETDAQEDGAQNLQEEEEEDKVTLDGDAAAELAEPLASAEAAEVSATVETQSKSRDPEEQGEAGADGEEGDEDRGYVVECAAAGRAGAEVSPTETTVKSSAQIPEEMQESL